MKIRNQFYILLSGILLIPVITFGAYMLVRSYNSPENMLIQSYKQFEFLTDITPEEKQNVLNIVSRLPPFMRVAIVNNEMKVIYSAIDIFEAGKSIKNDELIKALNGNRKYHYQIVRNNDLLILNQIKREPQRRRDPSDDFYKAGGVILIVIFAFCCVIITKIARSISTSVMLLDNATKRIAAGDLESNIDARGSNEITSLAHSLNMMRQSLKESQIRKSRFIMGASHDLRTPLSLIKGYTEAIADGMADAPDMRQKSLEIISLKINQLEEMIDDLINFTKLDSCEWKNTLTERKIYPILQSFAETLKEDANLFGHTAEIKIDIPQDTRLCLDEKLFVRALENLCSNAFRYTPKGGIISFIAALTDPKTEPKTELLQSGTENQPESAASSLSSYNSCKKIKIIIRDTGTGIEQSDIPFIFDPLYRGSNSRREDGKGLGLAVVKTVVESHGWKIDVSSQKNIGTEFTLIM